MLPFMYNKPNLAIMIFLFVNLLITEPTLGRPEIKLLDITGNTIPPDLEEHIYIYINNHTYTFSELRTYFEKTFINTSKATIYYNFFGLNYSIKYIFEDNSSIILYIRPLKELNLSVYFLDNNNKWSVMTLTLKDVVSSRKIPGLVTFIQNTNTSIFLNESTSEIYFPLANVNNETYNWRFIAKFYNITLLNESLTDLWEKSEIYLPLAKIPENLNLTWINTTCPGTQIYASLKCGNEILKNYTSSSIINEHESFYPIFLNCDVHFYYQDKEETCKSKLMELYKCVPEIFPVEIAFGILQEGKPNALNVTRVKIEIDNMEINLQHPTLCLWKGTHNLLLQYNFSGKSVTIINKNFTVNSSMKIPLLLNFSRIRVLVKGCSFEPQVLVNSIKMSVEKENESYVTEALPVMDANLTIIACNITISSNLKINNPTFLIVVPPITNLKFEHVDLLPLLLFLILYLFQISLGAYAFLKLRRL